MQLGVKNDGGPIVCCVTIQMKYYKTALRDDKVQ